MELPVFLKKMPGFQAIWDVYAHFFNYFNHRRETFEFLAWATDIVSYGLLLSIAFSSLLGYQWTPWLWLGSGCARWMFFEVLNESASIIKRKRV